MAGKQINKVQLLHFEIKTSQKTQHLAVVVASSCCNQLRNQLQWQCIMYISIHNNTFAYNQNINEFNYSSV